MPLTEDQLALLQCIRDGEIESVEGYLEAFPPPDSINFEDDECQSLGLTALITSVYYKQHAITELLRAKGADPCHITAVGTNVLSTAFRANDPQMVTVFQPLFQQHVWGGGEERLLVEQVQGAMDDYYVASAAAKKEEWSLHYRAKWVPKLKGYREQITPLTQADKALLREKKAVLEKLLQERAHNDRKREMLASQISDAKEREAFIQADIAAHQKELEEYNRAQSEKAALAQKAAELEQKAKNLEAQLRESEQKRQLGEQRVKGLLEAQTQLKAAEMDRQYIKKQPILLVFWKRVRSKLNELFVGQQSRASGMVVKMDQSKSVENAIELAGDFIPLPGAKIAATLISKLVGLGLGYRAGQVEKREHNGFSAVAADAVEFNAIVEPTARHLTLGYEAQLLQLDEKNAEKLGECAVRLMLVYLLTTDPQSLSYFDQERLIAQLVLAVRTAHSASKLKDHRGHTIKPKEIEILTPMGAGKKPKVSKVAESKLFALYVDPLIGQSRRQTQLASQALPAGQLEPVSVKPQPLKAAELLPRPASPAQGLVLKTSGAGQQKLPIAAPAALVMVK